MSANLCACGTYAIGICAECGSPVCGTCSVMSEGKRICIAHVRQRAREAAEAQAQAQAEEARVRETWENDRVQLAPEAAFDLLFLSGGDQRMLNSAAAVLLGLEPADFTAAALTAIRATGAPPVKASRSSGSRRGLISGTIWKLRSFNYWPIHGPYPPDVLRTDGQWGRAAEEGGSYPIELTPDMIATIVEWRRSRPDAGSVLYRRW